jgi:hypothetical protein
MAVIFVLLIVLAAIAIVALVTYMLGMWSSVERQQNADPAAPVRHDDQTVTRGDPTPTNR